MKKISSYFERQNDSSKSDEEKISSAGPSIKGTDHDDKDKKAIAQSSRRDVTECEDCLGKDSIKKLEDVVSKLIQLTRANQIIEERDGKIMQLQKELEERNREVADKTSQIAKLSKHNKEQQDVHKETQKKLKKTGRISRT